MKKIKVSLYFIQLSIAEKITYFLNVIAKMTGNVFFPEPDIPLAEVKTSVDTLSASYLASRDGSHTAISKLHDDEDATDHLFRILAAYVDRIADGDETKILSAGFQGTSQPTPHQKADLVVVDGPNSGSAKLVAKAIAGARAYIWQISINGTDWTTVDTTTRSSYEMDGLPVAEIRYFRVAGVTPEGTTDFTAPVKKVIV